MTTVYSNMKKYNHDRNHMCFYHLSFFVIGIRLKKALTLTRSYLRGFKFAIQGWFNANHDNNLLEHEKVQS